MFSAAAAHLGHATTQGDSVPLVVYFDFRAGTRTTARTWGRRPAALVGDRLGAIPQPATHAGSALCIARGKVRQSEVAGCGGAAFGGPFRVAQPPHSSQPPLPQMAAAIAAARRSHHPDSHSDDTARIMANRKRHAVRERRTANGRATAAHAAAASAAARTRSCATRAHSLQCEPLRLT